MIYLWGPEQGEQAHERSDREALRRHGVEIADNAIIGDGVLMGNGVTVCANAVVLSGARLGRGSSILAGAVVEEDAIIGDGAIVDRFATVGKGARVYDGAIVDERVTVAAGERYLPGAIERTIRALKVYAGPEDWMPDFRAIYRHLTEGSEPPDWYEEVMAEAAKKAAKKGTK